jgi:hypothetical protein
MEDSDSKAAVVDGMLAGLMRWLTATGKECRWFAWALAAAVFLYVACVAAFGTGPINHDANDALILLDGGWRILNGQIPHRDFYLALGPLQYMIVAGGMWLTGGTPKGLSVGIAIAGACTAIWGWRIARSRMPLVPALLVTAWLALTATCPAPLDSSLNALSCSMIYNRLGYTLLAIVLVECAFVHQRSRFWGGVSSGAIVVLLLFLKLNFFGAAVLLLLVTAPLRRIEFARWWGILAGAVAMFAMFCLYLRFALSAFRADMWLAIHSRSEFLSFRRIAIELPGSGEAITLFLVTVLTVLLVAPGGIRRSPGVRTILLACATIAMSTLLRSTNAMETGFRLMAFWALVLVALLAVAYPNVKEKAAIAVLALAALGGIAAQCYMDCVSMATLLKFRTPARWSQGMSIAGYNMDGLRFFDNPDSDIRHGDNGRLFAMYASDGVRLLESSSQQSEKVATIGYYNPFPYVLRRKPAMGGSPWLMLGSNITTAHPPDPQRIFGDADLIMEPHYESTHENSDLLIEKAYQPYLLQHYTLVGQSEWWTLYRRNQ